MYRVSPFTYWIGGMASTLLHGRPVECTASETSHFNPPPNQTCGQYLAPYLETAPGILQNPEATQNCQYCSLAVSDQFLAGSNIYYSERWRNWGIMWAFVGFNIFMAIMTYYLFRVAKWSKGGKKTKKGGQAKEGAEKVVGQVAQEGAAPPNREV